VHSVSDLELERAASFRAALRRFLARTEEIASAVGLTPQRYDLLLAIKTAPNETATVTDLCGLLSLSQTAVSELVKRAEQAGLVTKSTSPTDGRVTVLALTKQGERMMLETFIGLRDDRRQLFEAMSDLGLSFRALLHSHDEVI
jgi:DNA-binding MarR family transcriptional regulator